MSSMELTARPQARREGVVARPLHGGLVILSPGHRVHRLDAVSAWIWTHADGARTVDALLMGLRAEVHGDADRELVFEALDRLADAGLIETRVAPPSGLSRRVLLQRLAGASALAALTSVVGLPGVAGAKAPEVCGDEAALIDEIAWLEAEEAAVGDILETWLDEAEGDKETDELYIKKLTAEEQGVKKQADAYDDKRADAEEDLAECHLEAKKGPQIEARQERRQKYFAKRHEHLAKRREHAKERYHKRDNKLTAKESAQKAKLDAQEAKYKGKKKTTDDEAALSQQELQEAQQKNVEHHKLRVKDREMRHKTREKHFDERGAHLKQRQEQDQKKANDRLVSAEERQKFKAQAYGAQATEQASKDAGVQDHALERAQAIALKVSAAAEKERKAAGEQAIKNK